VRLLLYSNADVNVRNAANETPLHSVARKGHAEIASLLLDSDTDGDALNIDQETPLHLAARNGHEAVVGLLIDSNADVDVLNENQETPLRVAWDQGHDSIVCVLFNAGATVLIPLTQEMIDLAKQRGLEPVASVLQHQIDTKSIKMIRAALLPDTDFIQSIIDQGVNVNHVFNEENSNWSKLEGKTALHVAAATTGDLDVIQLLLDSGADRTIHDMDGNTAAQLAFKNHHFDAARKLYTSIAQYFVYYLSGIFPE
jgi:ankyrin repeat protein